MSSRCFFILNCTTSFYQILLQFAADRKKEVFGAAGDIEFWFL